MSVQPIPTPEIPEWTLGDRLRKARRHAHIGVSEMADHLEVDRDTVNNYEADRTRPRRSVLFVYAGVCGVPLTWIETGDPAEERRQGQKPHRGKDRRTLGRGSNSSWRFNMGDPAQQGPLLVSPRLMVPVETMVPPNGIATLDANESDLVIDLAAAR